ncbi:MAG: 4-demethylwyosine synthase TYW1 [Nanoarchaeota archaeon]|nr:4-demethylwyosine synthase TYW1 [Nanoarchaeota archaeon]
MLSDLKKKDLYKQGYRLAGNHSAIKVCLWTKKCIRGEDECYKSTFYGIQSHRCIQMTPSFVCSQRCVWCWRDIDFTPAKWEGAVDEPEFVIDECIKEHKKYLQGFKAGCDPKIFAEAMEPKHFAISLSGEPTFYPKLPELIDQIKKRGMTAFLVTNGTNPKMLHRLLENGFEPTQLYITLPAPNEESYIKACSPLAKDNWRKIMESLSLLNKFERNVIRLTLVKGVNMNNIEQYAEIIKRFKPMFVEAKAYVWVGHSKDRLEIKDMPVHEEIMEFAGELAKSIGYKIIDEKKESRVTLLGSCDIAMPGRL